MRKQNPPKKKLKKKLPSKIPLKKKTKKKQSSLNKDLAKLGKLLTRHERVVLLGVGSELRGDDFAGVMLAERLEKTVRSPLFKALAGHTAPENFTGEILAHKPNLVIIVDAAEIKASAGTIKLIDEKDVAGVTFSTHVLPLSVLARYLRHEAPLELVIVGIKPVTLEFEASVSSAVEIAVNDLACIFEKHFNR